MKDVLTPYPNTTYRDRFQRETEKRLADMAIANAQMAVVASAEIVSQIADVNAQSVALQEETNPDYKVKLDQEAGAENKSNADNEAGEITENDEE